MNRRDNAPLSFFDPGAAGKMSAIVGYAASAKTPVALTLASRGPMGARRARPVEKKERSMQTKQEKIQALGALAAAITAESLASGDAADAGITATRLEADALLKDSTTLSLGDLPERATELAREAASNLQAQAVVARRVREQLQELCMKAGLL